MAELHDDAARLEAAVQSLRCTAADNVQAASSALELFKDVNFASHSLPFLKDLVDAVVCAMYAHAAVPHVQALACQLLTRLCCSLEAFHKHWLRRLPWVFVHPVVRAAQLHALDPSVQRRACMVFEVIARATSSDPPNACFFSTFVSVALAALAKHADAPKVVRAGLRMLATCAAMSDEALSEPWCGTLMAPHGDVTMACFELLRRDTSGLHLPEALAVLQRLVGGGFTAGELHVLRTTALQWLTRQELFPAPPAEMPESGKACLKSFVAIVQAVLENKEDQEDGTRRDAAVIAAATLLADLTRGLRMRGAWLRAVAAVSHDAASCVAASSAASPTLCAVLADTARVCVRGGHDPAAPHRVTEIAHVVASFLDATMPSHKRDAIQTHAVVTAALLPPTGCSEAVLPAVLRLHRRCSYMPMTDDFWELYTNLTSTAAPSAALCYRMLAFANTVIFTFAATDFWSALCWCMGAHPSALHIQLIGCKVLGKLPRRGIDEQWETRVRAARLVSAALARWPHDAELQGVAVHALQNVLE